MLKWLQFLFSTDEPVTYTPLEASVYFTIVADFLVGVRGRLFFTGSLDQLHTFFHTCRWLMLVSIADVSLEKIRGVNCMFPIVVPSKDSKCVMCVWQERGKNERRNRNGNGKQMTSRCLVAYKVDIPVFTSCAYLHVVLGPLLTMGHMQQFPCNLRGV